MLKIALITIAMLLLLAALHIINIAIISIYIIWTTSLDQLFHPRRERLSWNNKTKKYEIR